MALDTLRKLTTAVHVIATHPLTRGRRLRSLVRYVGENVERRLAPPRSYPYVEGLRIGGIAGVSWLGLVEFGDQGFLLHFLRPGDLFLDVGAHVGSYTLLAAGPCGARAVSIEPSPETFAKLRANLAENGLADRVRAVHAGAASEPGRLVFTTGSSGLNHVSTGEEKGGAHAVEVPVQPVDDVLAGEVPVLMKVDVEGFERPVLEGARRTLADPRLKAVIIEISGWGERYGYTDAEVHALLAEHGFHPYAYSPESRELRAHASRELTPENTIYLRDEAFARERVRSGRRFRVFEQSF